MRSPLIALFASASPNRDGDSRMSEAAKIKKLPLLVISSTLASLSSSKMETWSSPTAASPILSRAGGLIRVGYLVSPFSQPCLNPVFIPDLNGSPPLWSLLHAKGGFVNLTGMSVFPSQPFEFLERVRMHEFAEGTLHPFKYAQS
ncbi:hypothetical protein MUK42_28020 [Musa troglodytarum]|uniref:Uncharacterized protein n=1 Tax=Musa troglodytarum TaxID=320322 RepID=A0A9E7F1G7_9LILI|nr:hypothetical protein MUK42_28020 [Musa troglodytarum]URD86318.1 hypothetical protein MUK42_28020 [Musa troglodytarum]